jgi:hypothetical protein
VHLQSTPLLLYLLRRKNRTNIGFIEPVWLTGRSIVVDATQNHPMEGYLSA